MKLYIIYIYLYNLYFKDEKCEKMVNKHCNIILSDTYIKYKKNITIIIEMRIYYIV